MWPVRLAMLALVLAVTAGTADATFCRKRNGAVFARERCKGKEAQIDLAAVTVAPQGDPGAGGVSQPQARAVDATGRRVPGMFGLDGSFVYAKEGRPFAVDLDRDGFGGGEFYFTGAMCTEERLLLFQEREMYGRAAVVGTTAYYPGEPVAVRDLRSYSSRMLLADCVILGGIFDATTDRCCIDYPSSLRGPTAPAIPFDLGGFVPPFHAEVVE